MLNTFCIIIIIWEIIKSQKVMLLNWLIFLVYEEKYSKLNMKRKQAPNVCKAGKFGPRGAKSCQQGPIGVNIGQQG